MSYGEDSKRVAPVRDAAPFNNNVSGSGHEKYPSWPMAAVANVPLATRAPPTGSSQRSKSWTDHSNYDKESIVYFARPFMKRNQNIVNTQLKTVLERSERNNYHNSQVTYPESEDLPERDTNNMQKLKPMDDSKTKLTQAELEEYTRKYDDINIQHHKLPSYAQSEGYHSYVSSADSTSTPFMDRLRRDIDNPSVRNIHSWDRDSVVTTSSGSASSSETLKWHGSLSDVSVASSAINPTRHQLIAHSARVKTPQRHNSESILYITKNELAESGNNLSKLFPIATYTLHRPPSEVRQIRQRVKSMYCSPATPSPQKSVADRVQQFEKQTTTTKYSYLDPDKKTKLSDPALKAIQKKALMMFYERHQGKSEAADKEKSPEVQPNNGEFYPVNNVPRNTHIKQSSMYELSNSNPTIIIDSPEDESNKSLMNNDSHESPLQGPVILGPSISLDDWVPERPPKNPQLLRSAFPDLYQARSQSPDPPLPPPPLQSSEDENIVLSDEPFPPPPVEVVEVQRATGQESATLQRLRRFPLPPLRPTVPLKREYPSTKVTRMNDAVRRNSFANSSDVILRNPEKACPLKSAVATSHKSLQRSTTVDETNNRKPINPYLRSTSMKSDSGRRSSADFSLYNESRKSFSGSNVSLNRKSVHFSGELLMQSPRPRPNYLPLMNSDQENKTIVSKHNSPTKQNDAGLQRAVPLKQFIQKELIDPTPEPESDISPKSEDKTNNEEILIETPKVENVTEIPNEDLKVSEPSKDSIETKMIFRLKPRSKLSTELEWSKISSYMVSILPKDNHLFSLISQYQDYNKIIKRVTETFEIEISSIGESLKEYYEEKTEQLVPTKQDEEINTSIENISELTVKAEECLQLLKSQLNEEAVKLQKSQEDNEKLKNEVIELLPKNNRILRYIDDIGGVASLIMMIQSRLALYSSPVQVTDHSEDQKTAIESKMKKLQEKLKDAKDLKESIDKRGKALMKTIFSQLKDDKLINKYDFLIGEKIRLVVYNKDLKYNQELINQLIKFLEENK